jgi:SAM-dependent methyltransferase
LPDEVGATLYSPTFFDDISASSLASARIVLPVLFEAIPVASVVDVGCGTASWLRVAIELGIDDVVGLDGDYVDPGQLMIEPQRFRPCDLQVGNLRHALATSRRFDLAMCLEVAEHLSEARAESFVGELCDLSDLVLFSAAVPGQGGTHHINEQWPSYWNALFVSRGFTCFDVLRSKLWHEEACSFWYLQNMLLFARRETASFMRVAELGLGKEAAPLPLVHPRMLKDKLEWVTAMIAELAEKDATITALRASTSWRITAPMRGTITLLRRYLRGMRSR